MEATRISGFAGGHPYTATLNGVGEDGQPEPVVLDTVLRMMLPAEGERVSTSSVGVSVNFHRADPAAVAVWLHGATDVTSVSGPDLVPSQPLTPQGAVN